jgi:putative heme iron utilization protein
MPFSSKAREIYDHIVSTGKVNYWIGIARSLVEWKDRRPGGGYNRDVCALRDKLKAELSGAVNDAHDHHWEEIAHWLVYDARY